MKKQFKKYIFIFFILLIGISYAEEKLRPAVTQSISIAELENFEKNPLVVKQLLLQALTLAQKHITYLYGSADPKNKGMDCSGTIYYLLKNSGLNDVPRSSLEIYQWVLKEGKFQAVHDHNFNSSEFSKLKPGDLLFWTGTYHVHRNPPISHVMLYLGKNKQGQRLMVGASDGRTYQGKSMWGVSVFDFKLPALDSSGHFIGYSCIPKLTC